MDCPKCPGRLWKKQVEGTPVYVCHVCHGVWLSPNHVNQILIWNELKFDWSEIDQNLEIDPTFQNISLEREVGVCPQCDHKTELIKQPMRKNRAIMLDVCPEGHGIWLDGVQLVKAREKSHKTWLWLVGLIAAVCLIVLGYWFYQQQSGQLEDYYEQQLFQSIPPIAENRQTEVVNEDVLKLLRKGKQFIQANDPKNALGYFQMAAELQISLSDMQQNVYAETLYFQAYTYERLGLKNQAINFYMQEIEMRDAIKDEAAYRVNPLLDIGLLQASSQNIEESIRLFRLAEQKSKAIGYKKGQMIAGNSLKVLLDHMEATKYGQIIESMMPKVQKELLAADMLVELALMYMHVEKYEEALHEMRKAIDIFNQYGHPSSYHKNFRYIQILEQKLSQNASFIEQKRKEIKLFTGRPAGIEQYDIQKFFLSDYSEKRGSVALLLQGIRIENEMRDYEQLAQSFLYIGQQFKQLGRLGLAQKSFQAALQLSEEHGYGWVKKNIVERLKQIKLDQMNKEKELKAAKMLAQKESLSEEGYRRVSQTGSVSAMKIYIQRVIHDKLRGKITNQGSFNGFVPWFTQNVPGVATPEPGRGRQSLEQMIKELKAVKWIESL